jgi:hypothetical protein
MRPAQTDFLSDELGNDRPKLSINSSELGFRPLSNDIAQRE